MAKQDKKEYVEFVPHADVNRIEIAVPHLDKVVVVEPDGLKVETSDVATIAELDAHPSVKRATKGS